jgi:hypothetical protein
MQFSRFSRLKNLHPRRGPLAGFAAYTPSQNLKLILSTNFDMEIERLLNAGTQFYQQASLN